MRWGKYLFLVPFILSSLAFADVTTYSTGPCQKLENAKDLLRCYAPAFVCEGTDDDNNKIGSPEIHWVESSILPIEKEMVVVNPERPALYAQVANGFVKNQEVYHLVYRAHFKKTWGFSHLYLPHKNAAILSVVTIDAGTHRPLYISTILGTGFDLHVSEVEESFGRSFDPRASRLSIHLRSSDHSVIKTEFSSIPSNATSLALQAMEYLHWMPVIGNEDVHSSIFYTSGAWYGLVKGSLGFEKDISLPALLLQARLIVPEVANAEDTLSSF